MRTAAVRVDDWARSYAALEALVELKEGAGGGFAVQTGYLAGTPNYIDWGI